MATSSVDNLASRLATILRHLLIIEADASNSTDSHYSTEMSPEEGLGDDCRGEHEDEDEPSGCNGKVTQGGNVLRIYIPYYGTIRIQRQRVVSKSGISTAARHSHRPLAAQPSPGAPQFFSTEADRRQSPTEVFIFDGDDTGVQCFPVFDPDLAAETDDWALQGVDMAFFDSLIRGMTEENSQVGAGESVGG